MISGIFVRNYYDDKLDKTFKNKIRYNTQNELADGWRIQLPKRNMRKKIIKDEIKWYNHLYTNEVTLAQLPEHLWNKITFNKVRDRFFIFKIIKTDFDEEIKELFNLVTNLPNDINRMKELVNILNNNNITGWVLTRAENYIKDIYYYDNILYFIS